MRLTYLLAACAALIAVPSAQAVPADSPATAVGHDTECLVLFLVAAGDTKEPKVQQAAIAGSWYFLGKVDGRAPGLDVVSALRSKETELRGNPRAGQIGTACDAELARRGADLLDIGKQVDSPPPASSSS